MTFFYLLLVATAYAGSLSLLALFRDTWLFKAPVARVVQGLLLIALVITASLNRSPGFAGIWELVLLLFLVAMPVSPWAFLMSIDAWQAWDRRRTTTYAGELKDIYRKAELAMEQDEFSLAIDLLEDALHEYENQPVILQKLLAISMAKKDYLRATEYMKKSLTLEPKPHSKGKMQLELADLYVDKLHDAERARILLNSVVLAHDGTALGKQAQQQLQALPSKETT